MDTHSRKSSRSGLELEHDLSLVSHWWLLAAVVGLDVVAVVVVVAAAAGGGQGPALQKGNPSSILLSWSS